MKPTQAIVINAVLLILLGLWGYLASPEYRSTELIPIVFGLLFLASVLPIRFENRIVEFMLRILLFLLVVALTLSLIRAINNANVGNIIRLSLMILATGYTLLIFVIKLRKRLQERKKNRNNR